MKEVRDKETDVLGVVRPSRQYSQNPTLSMSRCQILHAVVNRNNVIEAGMFY